MTEYEYEYVSECCSASPRSNGDCDTSDFGICAECGDSCIYGYYNNKGNFFESKKDAEKNDNYCELEQIDSVS